MVSCVSVSVGVLGSREREGERMREGKEGRGRSSISYVSVCNASCGERRYIGGGGE